MKKIYLILALTFFASNVHSQQAAGQDEKLIISLSTVNKIYRYLVLKPYGETALLIQELTKLKPYVEINNKSVREEKIAGD